VKDRVAAFYLTPMEKRMLDMRVAGMDVTAIASELACAKQNVFRTLLSARRKLLADTDEQAIEIWRKTHG
jgi:DNA-binding CsgD family transcriptional regulator